jgi:hypothetical protein
MSVVSKNRGSIEEGRITAMGFASVLTNKDVTLSVSDIVGLVQEFRTGGRKTWGYSAISRSLQCEHIPNHRRLLATARRSFNA